MSTEERSRGGLVMSALLTSTGSSGPDRKKKGENERRRKRKNEGDLPALKPGIPLHVQLVTHRYKDQSS